MRTALLYGLMIMTGHESLVLGLLQKQGELQGQILWITIRTKETQVWQSKIEDQLRKLEIKIALWSAGGGLFGMMVARIVEGLIEG